MISLFPWDVEARVEFQLGEPALLRTITARADDARANGKPNPWFVPGSPEWEQSLDSEGVGGAEG